MTVGEILKKRRLEKKLSLRQLSYKIGFSHTNIADIEKGIVKKIDSIKKIMEALDFTEKEKMEILLQLAYEKTPNEIKEKLKNISRDETSNIKVLYEDDFIEMPVKAKASAGNGYINFEETLYTRLIRKGTFCTDCYLIEVSGNSMEPLIQDGAFVIVDPHQTEYIANKIYVVKVGEETYVKRVIINREAGVIVLKSINPEYEDKYIMGKELENVKLLGRAIRFVYEGNL